MKVVIKPLPIKRWHGKTGKEDFSRPKSIRALVNPEKNVYDTGLTEKDIEKLKEQGIQWELSNTFDPEKPHPFWDTKTATVKLENSTMIFDTSIPLDFIKVKLLKASKFVANSIEEWEEGKYPEATHYIVDEEEAIEKKAKRVELKKKAYILSDELSVDRKADIILVLTGKLVRRESPKYIEVEFAKLIEKKAPEVIKWAEKDNKEVKVLSLVLEGINRNILSKRKMGIFYGDLKLGHTADDAAEELLKDENQEIYIELLSKLG